MKRLCCSSDYNGDGFLAVEDFRLYLLWFYYTDKQKTPAEQMLETEGVYSLLFPNDPPVTMIALPELDCSDFNDDLILAVEDFRLYLVWFYYANKSDPIPDQLQQSMDTYAFLYPSDPAVVMVRRPELLDPANCEHGWFITPWHDQLILGGQPVGWLQ